MKRILLGFSLLLSLSLSAQSWQSKPVVRIEDAGQSFLYTFSDSSDAYINKCNVSYIVNLPNSQWVQLGYMYDGSTSRIITASYSAITQPDLASAKILSDTLNAWLVDCAVVVGDSTLQTLSIYGDTLSISDGNSVILPVYVQVDSAVITSYDVLNSQNAPPVSPATGDIYLVGNSPSGAWVGHAKDIAEWNGSGWVFTDGVQGDFLYNATNALTYIFRSGNWVQTTGIPALNNGNTISSGLRIGTNNARSLTFETNNVNRGRFDSVGRFYVYDTSLRKANKYLQIDSITGRLVASEISGGGGGGDIFITKTKAEIDALISTNALVKGATYKITGVHPTLYDDGTTSGTTIILKAISENVLETQGTGIFYNPKYNQSIDGFGIWDNKMYGTFSTIVGTFDYTNKETITADNSATGILLADGMIQFISGDWSTAISITGDVSGATANVADFVSPSYAINDKVIWGGYSWTNVNGNIGASTDVLNLNSEWTKDFYDTTNYNIAYDLIEYDYTNDWISRRYEAESNVDVKITKSNFDLLVAIYGLIYSSISVQQFGNPLDFSTGKGILNKFIDNGYDESINFLGSYQYNLTFGQYSRQHNLTFGASSYQQNLTFGQDSRQSVLTFGQDSNQYNLTFGQYSYQGNLTFGQDSRQYNLTFGASSYQGNLTFGASSYQGNLTFGQNSNQNNLTFGQGSQLNYDLQTLLSNMSFVNFRTKSVIIPILTAATYIFDGNIKEVYQRPDGTLKLTFINNIDILQIQLITD